MPFFLSFIMSTNCGVCSQPCVADESDVVVRCNGVCSRLFHSRCVKDDLTGKKTRSFKDWKCKDCRNTSSAPSSVESTSCTSLTKDYFVSVLENFKFEVFKELKIFRGEVEELSTSVKFLSDKMDESTKLLKEVKSELATVKKENEELKIKNAAMSSDVCSLKDKIRSLEQYTRKNNIEISGLPVTARENVVDLVKDVGVSLGLDFHATDISAAHRVPSYNRERTPALIVQFINRTSRDDWLKRFREKKGLTAHQVNSAFPHQNIYINEHLSPDNKVFLANLKSKCKEVGYSFAWCRDGKFFVRRAQGERFKRINTYDDVEKLK